LFLLLFSNIGIFSQSPLVLNIDIEEEIYLEGQIVIFNGWQPNLRMIIMDDYIIGIDENFIPEELVTILQYGLPKGFFKLKLVDKIDVQYYQTKLLIFRIIEYDVIEILHYE